MWPVHYVIDLLTVGALVALATEVVVLHTYSLPYGILRGHLRTHSYNLYYIAQWTCDHGVGVHSAEGYGITRHTSNRLCSTHLSHSLVARSEGDLGYRLSN